MSLFFRREGEPEVCAGHWLWGSARDFQENAVRMLHRSHKKYGDIFTLRLINQYLTIIMDPHSYDSMTRERNFDFEPIQAQVNWNVFGFVLHEPRKMIKDTGRTVRGVGLERGMNNFSRHLETAYQRLIPSTQDWKNDGLRLFTARTIFDGLFKSIFGAEHHEFFNSETVFHNFEKFHVFFNYFWLGLPKKLFPSAMKVNKHY